MRGASRASFSMAHEQLTAALEGRIAAARLGDELFAVAHLPEGGAAGPLYIAALDTFVLSLVLIYLREKTGSLWASITLHAVSLPGYTIAQEAEAF